MSATRSWRLVLPLAADAFAEIFELIGLDAVGRPGVVRYAYWLVAGEGPILGYDLDPSHDPASHWHIEGGPGEPCAPVRLEEALREFQEIIRRRTR